MIKTKIYPFLTSFINGFKDFISIILKHNIFFHASAISYYAALAIAPFLLILLQIGSLLGEDLKYKLILQTYLVLGPEVGKITEMIFNNATEGFNLASSSGLIGIIVLLFTASIVFLQLRFTLDNIYGVYDPDLSRSFWEIVKERVFSMGIVVGIAVLFFLSLFVSNIVTFLGGSSMDSGFWGFILTTTLNFILNLIMFTALYYFAPSKRPVFKNAMEVAAFTSLAFLLGKKVMELYFKNIAVSSVYGATGTLLVFLIWAYYSSFTLFLSLEGFLFLSKKKAQSV
jgi:membrane protein